MKEKFKLIGCGVCVVFGALLSSCGSGVSGENQLINTFSDLIPLTEVNLFDGPTVQAYYRSESDSLRSANKLFLDGLNLYKNENKPEQAIVVFKESIYKFPAPKTYYEMGNAYLEIKDYESALKSFSIAEELGYEPFSKLLYNISCTYSLMNKTELSGKYLEFAIQAGYTNIEHLEKDSDLSNLRNSHYFKESLNRGLAGMSNSANLFFLNFKRGFPKADLPLKLTQKVHESVFENNGYISYDYEVYVAEMRNEKFSREVSKGFYYYAQLPEHTNYVALIYLVRDEFMEEASPLIYNLVTFTHAGKIIDKKLIAGQRYFDEPLRVCEVDKKGRLNITVYEVEYEKETSTDGYHNNKVVAQHQKGKETFYINEKGQIVQETEKVNEDVAMEFAQ